MATKNFEPTLFKKRTAAYLFKEKIAELTATLKEQMTKEKELDEQIKEQLAKIGFEL